MKRRIRASLALPAVLAGITLFAAACDNVPSESGLSPPERSETAIAEKAVLIGFVSTPGADEVALVESYGGTVTHQYKYISVFAATIPEDQEDALEAEASVAYVEDDLEVVAFAGKQITDWGVLKVEASGAWEQGSRGEGVKVGIFDTGIDLDHPDLTVAGGVDLVGDGFGIDDCHGHGTHVGGIVGATDNGNHTVGVAPKTELYAMRLLNCAGSGPLSDMILGLEWAIDNGMDVVNMSFGLVIPVPSQSEEAAMNAAYERGIVLVAASGNNSSPTVGFPAAYEAVIAVGATDDQDNLATFSQWGTEQELTAPGVNNLSSYLKGQGQETSLSVDTDDDRELEAIALQFAGMTRKKGMTAENVYAGFGTAADFQTVDCSGKTAVYSRGGGTFASTVENAMNAGCIAVTIHNNQPGNFNGTLGTETASDGRAWIPAVSISLTDGLYLRDQIEAQTTVTTLLNVAGNLAIFSGTSMASPHAAGVAALVRGKHPGLVPDAVRMILRQSAEDLGAPGWDAQYGYGRVNARRAVEGATP